MNMSKFFRIHQFFLAFFNPLDFVFLFLQKAQKSRKKPVSEAHFDFVGSYRLLFITFKSSNRQTPFSLGIGDVRKERRIRSLIKPHKYVGAVHGWYV